MSRRKILISNFLSLSGVQFANYILPLITVPYLVRVLGPEKYGLIAFSQAFIQYFVLMTDYGFILSATRAISINRDDTEKVSEIFCSVMMIKMALLVLSFSILCTVVLSISKFRTESALYFLTFGMVIGNFLFPVWLFLGLEKMKEIAAMNFLAKAIFTILLFILVRSKSDYIYIPLINSLGSIIAGLLSLWIVVKRFNIIITIPASLAIKQQLKEGRHVFISNIAVSLYTVSNTFILGILTNNTVVGYYSAGDKLIKAVAGLLTPLAQTIYPHISKLASESKETALIFVRKVVTVVGVPTFSISLMMLLFASQISDIILGKQFRESIPVIQILSFLPFIVALGNIFAVQGLYAFGYYSIVTKFLTGAAAFHIVVVMVLTNLYSYMGTSVSVLMTEIIVTFLSIYFFLKVIDKEVLVNELLKFRWRL